MDARRETAIHEAAHLVCAYALGGMPVEGDIIPFDDDNRLGIARYRRPPLIVSVVATKLVAGIATWEACDRNGSEFDAGDSDDLDSATKYLVEQYAADGQAITSADARTSDEWHEGMSTARDVCRDYWGAIIHVADWLCEHRTISGELVMAIVDEHNRKMEKRNARRIA